MELFIKIREKKFFFKILPEKDMSLFKYVLKMKKKLMPLKIKNKIIPSLKWSIIKSVPAYSNTSKKCQLCLTGKFEISNYPN